MATRPNKKPRWATVPTINGTTGKNNVIEPSEGKKDLGWNYLEKAARNTMNWVQNKAYEWIDYFDKNTKFLVIENDPLPDLSFKLQGGTYFTQGTTLVTIADATLGPVTAPAVDPRIDRVILNKSTGVVSITTGVEAASPVPIALLANEVALSQIALVVAQTEIVNADITDERPLWDTTLVASLTVAGISELSTDAEAIAKTDTGRNLTPSNLAALDSSLTFKGMIEKATDAEAIAKTDTDRALTPSNLAALVPSETVKGLAEIANQSEVDTGTDDLRYVTPLKLATKPVSIDQASLKSTTAENSTTSADAVVTLTGGEYAFLLQSKISDVLFICSSYGIAGGGEVFTNGLTYATRMKWSSDSGTATASIRHRYIQASPPYDLGDGEIPLFVYAVIHKSTGEILATSVAQDAPWHNNGPTYIRTDKIIDGIRCREQKDMSDVAFTYEQALLDPVKLMEYMTAFNSADTIYEPITQELKQKDMVLIPSPEFQLSDASGKDMSKDTVTVMLDPVCDLTHTLAEMSNQHGEFSMPDLIHGGYLKIDNTPSKLKGPPGILMPKYKWKLTK